MPKEIERKFLVRSDEWKQHVASGKDIVQGYLSTRASATVRVRLVGEEAYLTIKGSTRGATRDEFEYAIPVDDARQMLAGMCEAQLAKRRHLVPHEGHTWEVDVFAGRLAGLVVAEIELGAEDEAFARPDWLGADVTDDHQYANSALARRQ